MVKWLLIFAILRIFLTIRIRGGNIGPQSLCISNHVAVVPDFSTHPSTILSQVGKSSFSDRESDQNSSPTRIVLPKTTPKTSCCFHITWCKRTPKRPDLAHSSMRPRWWFNSTCHTAPKKWGLGQVRLRFKPPNWSQHWLNLAWFHEIYPNLV